MTAIMCLASLRRFKPDLLDSLNRHEKGEFDDEENPDASWGLWGGL